MSIHARNNFPFRKQQSDLDVALLDGVGDECYLSVLRDVLRHLLHVKSLKPDLVLYDAGVDVHHQDVLGNLKLTDEGIRFVFSFAMSAPAYVDL